MLSGGGARAAYQVGVLSAIAERIPHLSVPVLSGVSAGAINTTTLAAHPGSFKARVRALRHEWSRLTVDRVYHVRVTGLVRASLVWLGQRLIRRRVSPTVVRGLMDMEPLRGFLTERVDLGGIDANLRAGRLRAVTLSATCYTSGETVTFVHGREDVPTWERVQRRAVRAKITWGHVMASAAIPLVFPAVKIAAGYYGDGSVRQATPLAPAIHLGADRILAVGMRPQWSLLPVNPMPAEYPSAAQVMGMLFHSIFLDTLDADAERLQRLNDMLDVMPPGATPPGAVRRVELLVIRPSLDLGALARPHWGRLPPVMRTIVQSIGGHREGAADFVSYLLFEPAYTVPLMELGYDDVNEQWDTVERFLAGE